MKKSTMMLLFVLFLTACGSLSPSGQTVEKPQTPDSLAVSTQVSPSALSPAVSTAETKTGPSIDGATLLEERCADCHSANKVKQAPRSKSDWEVTVNRMIQKGAKLSDEEKQALVEYLAKTYGK
ncbi:MAG: hypothetical protein GYA12_14910 [Chloroflexi bacterium]|nr:hypothetical protein [Chloroflexota bacterium]BCY16960.1 hypothetical protein hrd7_08090 [Leptolinea sp. HRD-7]